MFTKILKNTISQFHKHKYTKIINYEFTKIILNYKITKQSAKAKILNANFSKIRELTVAHG